MPWDYGAATGSELHPVQKFILVVIKYTKIHTSIPSLLCRLLHALYIQKHV